MTTRRARAAPAPNSLKARIQGWARAYIERGCTPKRLAEQAPTSAMVRPKLGTERGSHGFWLG